MKRILLATILVVELVIGIVLYYSFSEVLSARKPNEPNRNVVGQLLSEQVSRSVPSIPPTDTPPQTTTGSSSEKASPQSSKQPLSLSSSVLRYFEPLPLVTQPANTHYTKELVTLGYLLFNDPRLSVNGTVSCNSCHLLDKHGVDGLALSAGHTGETVTRNSPTVYNAALHIAQFWDGRSPTLEEQAKEPLLSAAEMGFATPADVEEAVSAIPGYLSYFEDAFPGESNPISLNNIGISIGAFERQLLTPSRFDRFLMGEWNEFSADEFRGLGTFVEVGCTDCHQGLVVGGQLYKKLGIVEPYPTKDQGRYSVTRAESDRFVFKVPSLRNVAETAPYLHDGSVETLPEMVELMARYQLGEILDAQQTNDIVSFLKTLSGELPTEYIKPPLLP